MPLLANPLEPHGGGCNTDFLLNVGLFPGTYSTYQLADLEDLILIENPRNKDQKFQRKGGAAFPSIPAVVFKAPEGGASRLAIFSHGRGSDLGMLQLRLKNIAQFCKLHIIAYDFPGYGKFEGVADEEYVDSIILSVFRFAVEKLKFDSKQILLWGFSMGTGPTARLASRLYSEGTELGGLVMHGAFPSVREAGALTANVPRALMRLLVHEDRYDTRKALQKFAGPLLLLHGTEDELFPISTAHELLKGAEEAREDGGVESSRLVRLVPLEGVGHDDFDEIIHVASPLQSFLKDIETEGGRAYQKTEIDLWDLMRKSEDNQEGRGFVVPSVGLHRELLPVNTRGHAAKQKDGLRNMILKRKGSDICEEEQQERDANEVFPEFEEWGARLRREGREALDTMVRGRQGQDAWRLFQDKEVLFSYFVWRFLRWLDTLLEDRDTLREIQRPETSLLEAHRYIRRKILTQNPLATLDLILQKVSNEEASREKNAQGGGKEETPETDDRRERDLPTEETNHRAPMHWKGGSVLWRLYSLDVCGVVFVFHENESKGPDARGEKTSSIRPRGWAESLFDPQASLLPVLDRASRLLGGKGATSHSSEDQSSGLLMAVPLFADAPRMSKLAAFLLEAETETRGPKGGSTDKEEKMWDLALSAAAVCVYRLNLLEISGVLLLDGLGSAPPMWHPQGVDSFIQKLIRWPRDKSLFAARSALFPPFSNRPLQTDFPVLPPYLETRPEAPRLVFPKFDGERERRENPFFYSIPWPLPQGYRHVVLDRIVEASEREKAKGEKDRNKEKEKEGDSVLQAGELRGLVDRQAPRPLRLRFPCLLPPLSNTANQPFSAGVPPLMDLGRDRVGQGESAVEAGRRDGTSRLVDASGVRMSWRASSSEADMALERLLLEIGDELSLGMNENSRSSIGVGEETLRRASRSASSSPSGRRGEREGEGRTRTQTAGGAQRSKQTAQQTIPTSASSPSSAASPDKRNSGGEGEIRKKGKEQSLFVVDVENKMRAFKKFVSKCTGAMGLHMHPIAVDSGALAAFRVAICRSALSQPSQFEALILSLTASDALAQEMKGEVHRLIESAGGRVVDPDDESTKSRLALELLIAETVHESIVLPAYMQKPAAVPAPVQQPGVSLPTAPGAQHSSVNASGGLQSPPSKPVGPVRPHFTPRPGSSETPPDTQRDPGTERGYRGKMEENAEAVSEFHEGELKVESEETEGGEKLPRKPYSRDASPVGRGRLGP
uniref:Uncharacterized protein n=1 Tax=Chromera velia CCMP2878 TaxID=1169474 RepID=A0A0G4HHZ6_9ALVE|eukprot:Cvel_6940.t1-p1 / transcript=Cvel_6940.t1 / gene=Cvel_6940 / organism=Chromera_velia_CCMP2878 / gene_product=Alpha/beta hydrolase domain-containing protein 17C, putative / transcript_product=Alpha/beta hydrolase domain-containing protein 17C, putative / location=Cvel_scaffold351:62067-72487(+) / protein_length=1238 / sequence_SO=supercontig / SO=protein_coding / is_pseudo=false